MSGAPDLAPREGGSLPADHPVVSVVIAVHNLEAFIAETIESVLAQSFQRFELIVVVDSSTDATAAIARGYCDDPRVKVYEVSARAVSIGRNAGLRRSTAPYVLFLDGDDLLVPTALESFTKGFMQAPDAVAVVAAHDKIDEQGQPLPGEDAKSRPPFPSSDALRHLLERNSITNGGTICIRADVARELGGYDEALRECEDWDFWCRLACSGRFASIGQEATLLYRQRRLNPDTHSRSAEVNRLGLTIAAPFAPPPAAFAKVYTLPRVRAQFSQRQLKAMRRMMLIDRFWAGARAALYRGERAKFSLFLLVGVVRYPDSLVRGFLLRFLARQIVSRLKPSAVQASPGS
jgi:glycosyltransferase involved in cell wall biosynthesis